MKRFAVNFIVFGAVYILTASYLGYHLESWPGIIAVVAACAAIATYAQQSH